LEGELHLPNGQFTLPPDNVFRVVNEPFAAAAIYPAVLAAWTYLALFFVNCPLGTALSIIVFFAGFVGIIRYDQSLKGRPSR
jgi:hypothetical protein